MNDIETVIAKRRSVRSFNDKTVETEKLESILNSCIYAPTGMNKQTLFFVILQDKDNLNELYTKIPGVERCFYHCDAILFTLVRHDDHLNQLNCGAAIENGLLTATSLGVSSCWIHCAIDLLDTEEGRKTLKDILELDKEYQVMDCIALGYTDNIPDAKVRNLDGNKIL